MVKKIFVKFFFILISSFLSFIFLYTVYVQYCKFSQKDVVFLSNSKFIRDIYLDKDFLKILDKKDDLNENIIGFSFSEKKVLPNSDYFSTTQDLNKRVFLDSRIYNLVDMNGEMKYIYKPYINIANVTLWTGLGIASLVINDNLFDVYNGSSQNVLKKHVLFATDQFGFKKNRFSFKQK
jgi:hypothetical protein